MAVYELADGEAYKFVCVDVIKKGLKISDGEFKTLLASFVRSGLLIHAVVGTHVKMTMAGVLEAETIMESKYAEEELMVLEKAVELGRRESNGYVILEVLNRALPPLSMSVNEFVNELERKGFLGGGVDEATKVLPKGFEFLQKQSNTQGNISIYNTIHAGNNSNNAIGNDNNQSITQSINPDFASAIQNLTELIKASSLAELVKEERLDDLERIHRLGDKEQTPNVKQLDISKVELLRTSLQVVDLAMKAAPHLDKLTGFFGS